MFSAARNGIQQRKSTIGAGLVDRSKDTAARRTVKNKIGTYFASGTADMQRRQAEAVGDRGRDAQNDGETYALPAGLRYWSL